MSTKILTDKLFDDIVKAARKRTPGKESEAVELIQSHLMMIEYITDLKKSSKPAKKKSKKRKAETDLEKEKTTPTTP